MERELVEKVIGQAREEGSNLVVCDRRDTFTVENELLQEIEVSDEHLRARMEEGKSTVYVELCSIYKLVLEAERSNRSAGRAGFGS